MEEVIYSHNYSLNKLGLIYLLFCTCTFSKSHILLGNKQLSPVGGHEVFKLSYFESFYMPAFESWLTFRGTCMYSFEFHQVKRNLNIDT